MAAPASFDALIVGAGHGGAQTAIASLQGGFAGSIALVTDEREFPYERPPPCKEYLSGEKTTERLRIRSPAFWEERGISLILKTRIEAVDPVSHCATTRDGRQLTYDKLAWAAECSPKRLLLPEGLDGNVLTIRTLADADRLKEMLAR